MSERLSKGLEISKSEIKSGIVQTEKELAELRAKCRELEELLALARVTEFAAQMRAGSPPVAEPPAATEIKPPVPQAQGKPRSAPKTAHEPTSDEAVTLKPLPSLAERAAVIRAALDNK